MTAKDIASIRKALGETRETFGERFSCSARTVESWEQGLRSPHPLVVRELQRLAPTTRKSAEQ